MRIKRTGATKANCNHPACGVSSHVTKIPKEVRYRIAVDFKIFIPANSVACGRHIQTEAWNDAKAFITSEQFKYTNDQLDDMFQLLSNPPAKMGISKESSTHIKNDICNFIINNHLTFFCRL